MNKLFFGQLQASNVHFIQMTVQKVQGISLTAHCQSRRCLTCIESVYLLDGSCIWINTAYCRCFISYWRIFKPTVRQNPYLSFLINLHILRLERHLYRIDQTISLRINDQNIFSKRPVTNIYMLPNLYELFGGMLSQREFTCNFK